MKLESIIAILAPAKMGITKLGLLAMACGENGITPTEAAKNLGVVSASMSTHVSELEKDGLVVLLPVERDRRKILIRSTEKGALVIATLQDKFDEWLTAEQQTSA